ncbi:zinc finger CCCH domain-containing protein 13-like isoform X2 [Colletes gigas]|uniref:zinc finger CCCH domain-containing protein 13-like isoform X2 n=1 Tax=Colletes gigas TaxID=935657 RepID=UPI001C9B2773|nr:zinc finger CCCH domain-containing protein 13-like isoform X2 [Colletes gigas]
MVYARRLNYVFRLCSTQFGIVLRRYLYANFLRALANTIYLNYKNYPRKTIIKMTFVSVCYSSANMREKRWLLLALYGIVLANAVSAAVKATRPKFKIATTSTTTSTTTTEESHVHENENEDAESTATTVATETNGTTGHTLTGIPQIDYIWDPNLPRELNGYNLSDYPFYNSIPEDIDFKCDGLHDGFYASVPHKCQVYHHCLFGTRYDFLCANFTAFDQKTFICHFVSEVDCANSKKYWHRNDALYKAATTSTTSTSTTTTTTTTPPPVVAGAGRSRDRDSPRRRRPFRRRPAYDYYDEEYYDDDYTRPRGYSRDDYDYDDRKYRRDRDRDFRDRDRDFRDRDAPRDAPRSRDGVVRDDRDRDTSVRDRFPSRNNRRDPSRTRDPVEEDARPRPRDPDPGSRSASREVDDTELDDRRGESRVRDTDDRRYSDKRYRDEYDDKESVSASAITEANGDGLVKPAAPIASVYSRPRAPPKIRRPVPLSEQDKYAYKATAVQSTDPRRRPTDVAEDDYYEDELEDFRPVRRPMRRRPSYRDRDFYDTRDRDRDRDRDRPFRPRYRDEEDDLRPRKHSDRSRDRYYDRDRDRGADRGRDRSLDRGKDRTTDRTVDRDRGRPQDTEKQERPYSTRLLDRERDAERSRTGSRAKDLQETTDLPSRRPNSYERTTSTATTTTTCTPEQLIQKIESDVKDPANDRPERPSHTERPPRPLQSPPTRTPIEDEESHRTNQQPDYHERDQEERREHGQYHTSSLEEYSQDYYDEPEDPPAPPPRTAVRIVKRPFLPSRGGNPNPRGLSSVGSKATTPRRDEDRPTERTTVQERQKNYYENPPESHQESKAQQEEKETYDAYKTVQAETQREHRPEEYDTSIARPAIRRPVDRQREEEPQKVMEDAYVRESKHGQQEDRRDFDEGLAKWPSEDYSSEGTAQASSSSLRNKGRLTASENPNVYGSTFKTEENQEHPSGPGSFRVKQKINEVTHRLQDIPESEYDVTLNDALTPTLNQEPNLPSGFVLPLHRQVGRDAILQSSENNYKVSRPVNQQQQKPFVPSPQFLPTSNNDRLRTVYYRSSDPIQISGTQYRPQRGPWHDYTGY